MNGRGAQISISLTLAHTGSKLLRLMRPQSIRPQSILSRLLFVSILVLLFSGDLFGQASRRCDPKRYSVEEDPDSNSVKILRGGTVLHTIELLTEREQNGFAFDGAKKTKGGFELAVEYGSVIYYHKTFIFICRRHKFYLSKISVDSFNKHNPQKWTRKVIRVRPNLPLEKFALTDFMLEGVVRH